MRRPYLRIGIHEGEVIKQDDDFMLTYNTNSKSGPNNGGWSHD